MPQILGSRTARILHICTHRAQQSSSGPPFVRDSGRVRMEGARYRDMYESGSLWGQVRVADLEKKQIKGWEVCLGKVPEGLAARLSQKIRHSLHAPPRSGKQSPGTGSSLGHHRPVASALRHFAGKVRRLFLPSLSRLGLILLLLQYSTEFLFHMARLFYFADENNERL